MDSDVFEKMENVRYAGVLPVISGVMKNERFSSVMKNKGFSSVLNCVEIEGLSSVEDDMPDSITMVKILNSGKEIKMKYCINAGK